MGPSTVALIRRPSLSALMSVYEWSAMFGWLSNRNHEILCVKQRGRASTQAYISARDHVFLSITSFGRSVVRPARSKGRRRWGAVPLGGWGHMPRLGKVGRSARLTPRGLMARQYPQTFNRKRVPVASVVVARAEQLRTGIERDHLGAALRRGTLAVTPCAW